MTKSKFPKASISLKAEFPGQRGCSKHHVLELGGGAVGSACPSTPMTRASSSAIGPCRGLGSRHQDTALLPSRLGKSPNSKVARPGKTWRGGDAVKHRQCCWPGCISLRNQANLPDNTSFRGHNRWYFLLQVIFFPAFIICDLACTYKANSKGNR